MKTGTLSAATLAALLVLPVLAAAHHSFAAEWDANNCKDFVGILTKIDWQNPHPYFFVDIKDANGKVENWSFQAYSPSRCGGTAPTARSFSTTSARK